MSNWKPLLVPRDYGGTSYPEDFDREREYEFKRVWSDEVQRFKLADASEFFNVAGLLYREVRP